MKRFTAFGVVAFLSLALIGCTAPEPEPTQSAVTWVGSTVQQLDDHLPQDTTYIVYDVSIPVVDKKPLYGTASGGTNGDWLIVVSCGEPPELAVGVINVADYTEEIASSAANGDFNHLLTECSPK